ncbi:E3 ubiquitin-protein ligase RNF213-like [Eleutherodactylus coqui]|uniref:E3 ubiquitin-protein ligase RNF213-like n=1 Tax=Eleutherodactylus coqui TaxID=57060 RepID=UPI0034625C02
MKCLNCDHELPEETAKFCSMCGKPMQTPAPTNPVMQDDANKNLSPQTEVNLEPGKELVVDESNVTSCNPARIPEDEPMPLTEAAPTGRKRKKKNRKKKKGSSGNMDFVSLPATLDEHREVDSPSEDECKSLEEPADTSSSAAARHVSHGALSEIVCGNSDTIDVKESKLMTKEIQVSMEMEPGLVLCNKREGSEDQNGNQEFISKELIDKMAKDAEYQVVMGDTVTGQELKQEECPNQNKQDEKQDVAEKVTKSPHVIANSTTGKEDSDRKDKGNEGSGERSRDRAAGPDASGNAVTTSVERSENKDKVSEEQSKNLKTSPNTLGNDMNTSTKDSENKDKTIKEVKGGSNILSNESKSRLIDGKKLSEVNSNSDQQNMNATKPDPNLGGANKISNETSVVAQEADKLSQREKELPGAGDKADTTGSNPGNASRKNKKNAAGQNIRNESDNKTDANEPKANTPNKEHDKKNEEMKNNPETSKMKSGKNKDDDKAEKKTESKTPTSQHMQSTEKAKNLQNEAKRKAPSNEVPENYTTARELENHIAVYFHVIVSKDFGLKVNEDKVIVKAGNVKGYKDWGSVVCEMHCTKEFKDFGFLYEGHTSISKDNLNKNIPYKYVVQSNGKEEYEHISCKTEDTSHIINRCLFIPLPYDYKGDWHQYDDVCLKKNDGLIKKILNYMKDENKSMCHAKRKAGEIMLGSIYSILATCDGINLSSFFQQLHQFHYVASESLLYGNRPMKWSGQENVKDKMQHLMMNLLNKICDPFTNKDTQQETDPRLSRIIAGLICVQIVSRFGIHVDKQHLIKICHVLCLDEMPREKLIGELQNAKTLFTNLPE